MNWPNVHSLVQRAQAGDSLAWSQLCCLVQPCLLAGAHKLLGPNCPHQSFENLTQDTWLRAYQGFTEFRGGRDDEQTGTLLRAWLSRIMKHVCLNNARERRAARRQPPPGTVSLDARVGHDSKNGCAEVPGNDPTPSVDYRAKELRGRVEQFLNGLSDQRDAAIVRLRIFEELNYKEIAQYVGWSEGTVRGRFHATLAHLARALQEFR